MTCIVGLIDKNGKGHIASDSTGSNFYTKNNYKNMKIFRKEKLLIGYTSSYRMGQLLEHSLDLPKRKIEQTIENYMYVDFIESIRKLFKDCGYLKITDNREEIGTFIIIIEGRIFKMNDDLALLENQDNFDSCGSGEDFAMATINTLIQYTDMKPKALLTEAINTASKHVTTVGGEVQYLSADD